MVDLSITFISLCLAGTVADNKITKHDQQAANINAYKLMTSNKMAAMPIHERNNSEFLLPYNQTGILVISATSTKDLTTPSDEKTNGDKGSNVRADIDVNGISDGDTESADLDSESEEDSVDEDIEKVDIYGPPFDKRWVGDIFGGGYPYKRVGSVLGKGFALGKRYGYEYPLKGAVENNPAKPYANDQWESTAYDKESTGDKADFSYSRFDSDNIDNSLFMQDQFMDLSDKQKRVFGHRIGNGFALGKRNKRSIEPNDDDLERAMDKQPELMSDYTDNVLNFDDWDAKRYFASDIGSRFGRRSYSSDEIPPVHDYQAFDSKEGPDYYDKRYFDSDFGQRFIFGKRSGWKRYFGHVLGNGFRLGKRGEDGNELNDLGGPFPDNDEDTDDIYFLHPIEITPYVAEVLEKPHGSDELMVDKRFGHILGRGFRYGKRPVKRYGWVLGNGYMIGKRDSKSNRHSLADSLIKLFKTIDENEEIQKEFGLHNDKRSFKRFGHLLGHGFSFGKRQGDLNSNYIDTPYKREYYYNHYKRRPFGHVLGNGFAFGKRTLDSEYTSLKDKGDYKEVLDAEKRAFGHWLGNGFKLGKRSKEYPDDEYKMHFRK